MLSESKLQSPWFVKVTVTLSVNNVLGPPQMIWPVASVGLCKITVSYCVIQ